MPTKTKKKKKKKNPLEVIVPSDVDVIAPKDRKKRELPPIDPKKQIKTKHKTKTTKTTTTKATTKAIKTKKKKLKQKKPPIQSSIESGPSLVDVIIDQHHAGPQTSASPEPIKVTVGVDPNPITQSVNKTPVNVSQDQGKFILWMALSKEEKSGGTLFTKEELQSRQINRAKLALQVLAAKKKKKEEKKEAKKVLKKLQKSKARAKVRAKVRKKLKKKNLKKQIPVLDQIENIEQIEEMAIEIELQEKTNDAVIDDADEIDTSLSSPASPASPASPSKNPTLSSNLPSPTTTNNAATQIEPQVVTPVPSRSPFRSRPRFDRILISREENKGDRIYKEFNELLYKQDDHKIKTHLKKLQFRGGNPFFQQSTKETSLNKNNRKNNNTNNNTATHRKLRILKAGRFEEDFNNGTIKYYCQSRKCASQIYFENNDSYFIHCERCNHLNNKREFTRVGEKRYCQQSPPVIKSHSEISREKFKLKLRDRFLEQQNEVIRHLSDSAKACVSPGKRIWKEFDRTQVKSKN